MLTDMGTILRQAKKEGYGVAAPNAWSLNTVKSIFEAASELKAPVIIDGAGIHQIEEKSDAVHFYEKKFPEVTAALNLDHGGPFEEIIQAISGMFVFKSLSNMSKFCFYRNSNCMSNLYDFCNFSGILFKCQCRTV